MKFLRLLLFVLTAGILFTSCQKELSAETGSAIGTIAKDAGGNCTPATPSGAYKKDTALNATNFVDIQLDITNVGIYIVTTDTVNGYYFRATGVTPLPGVNIIRLVGFGKPIAAGTNLFKVKFNTDVCEFAVTVTGTTGGGGTNAVFTLGTTASACTGFTLGAGTYTPGTGLSATNTVTLNVNVTTPGAYTLNATTTAATGVTFTATGTFPAGTSGAATIILTAQPAPGNTGTSPTNTVAIPNATYSVSAGGTTCSFIVAFNAPPPPATFSFNCGTPTFTGTYQEGVNTAGGTLKIQVTSVAGGLCTISSDNQNAVTFSTTTVLAASPTPQDVILNASGVAGAAGSFTYTITGVGATGACSVNQTYSNAPATTGFIKANIDAGALTTFSSAASVVLIPLGAGQSITITADNGPTESFNCSLLSTSAITQGTVYTVNQLLSGNVINANYTTPTNADYFATSDPTPQLVNPFTIKFTSITATRAIGTFSGNLLDNNGAGPGIKTFTNGTFDLPF
jgi:hypothetical protein